MFDEMKAGSCENTSNRISLPKTIRPCTPHGPQQINNGWLRQPTALRNSSPNTCIPCLLAGFSFLIHLPSVFSKLVTDMVQNSRP